jgi:WD40 repeat protein
MIGSFCDAVSSATVVEKASSLLPRAVSSAMGVEKARGKDRKGSGAGLTISTGKDESGPFKLRRIVRVHRDKVHGVAVSGDTFATASSDGTVKMYSLQQDKVVKTFGEAQCRWANRTSIPPADIPPITSRHVTPRKNSRASPLFGSNVIAPGKPLAGLVLEKPPTKPMPKMSYLRSVAICDIPGMELLACGCLQGSVHVWNHQREERVLELTGHTEGVNSVAFHPSQRLLCSGSDDRTARVWDLANLGGTQLRLLQGHGGQVSGVSFLGVSMEYFVATCSLDCMARIYDLRDQTMVKKLPFHSNAVNGLAFSESKWLFATGGDDGMIALYDVRTWQRVQAIDADSDGSGGQVRRVAIDDTGRMLAAACETGAVLVYDVGRRAHAERVAKLEGHEEGAFDVAWGMEYTGTSRSRVLVSASHDATSRVWAER